MDLAQQIDINKRILKLIAKKYQDTAWTIYSAPESRYFRRLQDDVAKAELALQHNGLAVYPINPTEGEE